MNLASTLNSIESLLVKLGGLLQPLVLLVLRLWWGWSFVLTGWGKLTHLARTTAYFNDLGLPMPQLNAIAAGTTECLGGALLLLGLFSRWATVPLMFVMIVAYVTTERPALHAIFRDTDKFVSATPFQFLLVALLVFAFGPGKLSLDALVRKKNSIAPRIGG